MKRKYYEDYLSAAHAHTNDVKEIMSSELIACIYCNERFSPELIEAVMEEQSMEEEMIIAFCPYCGIDAIIGDKSGFPVDDPIFMAEMREYWF